MTWLSKAIVASWLLILVPSTFAQTERDSLLNGGNPHVARWAYFTDPPAGSREPRWYISAITSGKVAVYSLGPVVNHQAGWWTVGQSAASVNIFSNLVSIDPGLDTDPSNSFYDQGLQQWLNNVAIHSDRQRIQGTTVAIKWFFFQGPNGLWYILSAPDYGPTTILKFAESNGQYDWKATDTADFVPTYTNSGSTKFVRFTTTPVTPAALTVNGHTLSGAEDRWVRFIGTTVVPQLSGDRATRLRVAARSTWWALKEGLFGTPNPPAFSNCGSQNTRLGPLETCSATTWQVGLAGVQVPNFSDQEVSNVVNSLWPGRASADVLADAARVAGFDPSQGTGAAIVASSGVLRKSWLLRNSTVGITLVERNVTPECITGSRTWCYGTSWNETKWYAPTKDAALQSVSDLTTILSNLAP